MVNKPLIILIFLTAILLILDWPIISLFLLCLSVLAVLFFRIQKKRPNDQGVPSPHFHRFHSPVEGRILSINRNGHDANPMVEIRIMTLWWEDWKIRLPEDGEIRDVESQEGSSFFRYLKSPVSSSCHTHITLQDSGENFMGMKFVKCPSGGTPRLCVIPGDRGLRGAVIGYVPFGGTVFVYLPRECEILLKERQRVSPRKTLALMKRSL